jgi:hypothetical protein
VPSAAIFASNVIAKGPLMYEADDAPVILPTAVFVIVNKFAVDVVRIPDVSVRIPALVSDTGAVKETPFVLLIVTLLNVRPVPPMVCAVLPLKFIVPPFAVNVPLLLKLPAKFVVPEDAVSVPALIVSPFKVISVAAKLSVPLPIFVSEPVVAGIAPEIVRVFVVTSMDEVVPADKVKALFVPAVAPVYCNVPPPSTKFAGAAVA